MSSLKERLAALAASKRAELNQQSPKADELLAVKQEVDTSKLLGDTDLASQLVPESVPSQAATQAVVQEGTQLSPIEQSAPKPKLTSVVNMDNAGEYFDIKLKLKELEEALEYEVPGFAQILFKVHEAIRLDPNTVTIFSDEEMGLVVSALKRHTNITVSTTAPKSTKKTQKFDVNEL